MFRIGRGKRIVLLSFPRARGDVPDTAPLGFCRAAFSPRTRGCSQQKGKLCLSKSVFPAHAGMFPQPLFSIYDLDCFPRARGDVPDVLGDCRDGWQFSPRTRGCSGVSEQRKAVLDRFPRARGDVPTGKHRVNSIDEFSPRTRGCSATLRKRLMLANVFPAHAGMFLQVPHHRPAAHCFPRARGDVPHGIGPSLYISMFSPRTRGCSSWGPVASDAAVVFPAHAGMFRRPCYRPGRRSWFSPRTRGCSFQ